MCCFHFGLWYCWGCDSYWCRKHVPWKQYNRFEEFSRLCGPCRLEELRQELAAETAAYRRTVPWLPSAASSANPVWDPEADSSDSDSEFPYIQQDEKNKREERERRLAEEARRRAILWEAKVGRAWGRIRNGEEAASPPSSSPASLEIGTVVKPNGDFWLYT